jgi:hypothetical protein
VEGEAGPPPPLDARFLAGCEHARARKDYDYYDEETPKKGSERLYGAQGRRYGLTYDTLECSSKYLACGGGGGDRAREWGCGPGGPPQEEHASAAGVVPGLQRARGTRAIVRIHVFMDRWLYTCIHIYLYIGKGAVPRSKYGCLPSTLRVKSLSRFAAT